LINQNNRINLNGILGFHLPKFTFLQQSKEKEAVQWRRQWRDPRLADGGGTKGQRVCRWSEWGWLLAGRDRDRGSRAEQGRLAVVETAGGTGPA